MSSGGGRHCGRGADVKARDSECLEIRLIESRHQHGAARDPGDRAEHVVVFGSLVILIAGVTGSDQVGRWRARVSQSVGVSVFEAGHGQVAGTTEAGGAGTIGADPERGKPAEGTGSKKGDRVGRRMGACALWQTLELGGDAQDGLAWLECGRQTPTELGSASQKPARSRPDWTAAATGRARLLRAIGSRPSAAPTLRTACLAPRLT